MFFDVYSRLCKKIGKTPTSAALDMGIARSTVSAWKSEGRTPSGATLQKVADYFGVSTDYLLDKDNRSTNSGASDILDEVDVAFYGDYKELSDDDKEAVRDFVRVMRERRARKKQE